MSLLRVRPDNAVAVGSGGFDELVRLQAKPHQLDYVSAQPSESEILLGGRIIACREN